MAKKPVDYRTVDTGRVEYDIHGRSIKRFVARGADSIVIKSRADGDEIFIALHFDDTDEYLTLYIRPKEKGHKPPLTLGFHDPPNGLEESDTGSPD